MSAPVTNRRGMRSVLAGALAVLAVTLTGLTSASAARGPQVVYDDEYRGYVPIVSGIARPDLVTKAGQGRVPSDPDKARREARKALRRLARDRNRGVEPDSPRRLSRRWLRKRAVITDLLVLGPHDAPIRGARVYRYYDPSFYSVSQDRDGARLFGLYRYLPFPMPGEQAQRLAVEHDEYWRGLRFAPIRTLHADIDDRSNPWRRDTRLMPIPALEFVGYTDDAGTLQAISGVFNLRDEKRFARAIVPSALRIGYIILAEGYLPERSERRFQDGGITESRTIRLLGAPDHSFATDYALQAVRRLTGGVDMGPERSEAEVRAQVELLLNQIDKLAFRAPADRREQIVNKQKAEILVALSRQADLKHQEFLLLEARKYQPADPFPPFRLGVLFAVRAGLHGTGPARPGSTETLDPQDEEALLRAESLFRESRSLAPSFLPNYAWLDRVIARRGGGIDERARIIDALLETNPFDSWARARRAYFDLERHRINQAFDHLRYAWCASPGFGGDRELALALADYYWRLGLPEKSGTIAWMLTGSVPEDPFVRFIESHR